MNRNPKNSLSVGLLLLLLLGCSKNDLLPEVYHIVGTWRLYETGSSPGSGYFVKSIPEKPLQTLTFTGKGQLRKEGENLSGMFETPYYRLDSTQKGLNIILLANRKDATGNAARLRVKGDSMIIAPSCFEGCHFGFVRIR